MDYRRELFSCICNGFDMTIALDQVMHTLLTCIKGGYYDICIQSLH